jgi:hypothetical protein
MGEDQMVVEYVMREYAGMEARFRLRLGAYTSELDGRTLSLAESRALNRVERYADAIVVRPGELVIVEGKIRAEPGALGQLDLYELLVPLTAELKPFLNRPVVKELVCSIEDPLITAMARQREIRVKVYKPAWLPDYIAARNRREGRPKSSGGLGLE